MIRISFTNPEFDTIIDILEISDLRYDIDQSGNLIIDNVSVKDFSNEHAKVKALHSIVTLAQEYLLDDKIFIQNSFRP